MNRGMAYLLIVACLLASPAWSQRYILKANSDVIGHFASHQVKPGEAFIDIAQRYDVGYDELHAANPKVIPHALVPGTILLIPSLFLLPRPQWRQEMIINLSSRRLFFFPKNDRKHVYTFPVGIGRLCIVLRLFIDHLFLVGKKWFRLLF